jgi:hypothetical protein
MPFYRTQEAGFEIPSGWVDGTVTALEYKRPEGIFRVLVARNVTEDRPLSELVDMRLADQRRKLPFFELERRAEGLTAGMPSEEVVATFREGEQQSYQRGVSFIVNRMLLVISVNGPVALRGEMDAIFEQVSASVRPRPRGN